MIVTLFCDASFKDEKGGWGGWAKSDRGRVYYGGSLRGKWKGSEDTEMAAIANTLRLAKFAGILIPGDTVIIQSDCLWALNKLSKNIRPAKGKGQRAYNFIKHFEKAHYLFLKYKHVKAHEGGIHKRSAVNEACDEIARKGRLGKEIKYVVEYT